MKESPASPRFLKRKGIRPRLLTYFALALLLPALTTAAIVYATVRRSLLKAAFREQREISHRIAEKTGIHIENALRALTLLSIDHRQQGSASQIKISSLRQFLARSPDVLEITLYDSQGRGVSRAKRQNGRLVWGKCPHARAGRKEFSEAMAGRRFVGSVFVSEEEKIPSLILASPSGPGRGALIARLSLKTMWDIVDESASPTIHPFVVDETGRLVSHPNHSLLFSKTSWADRPSVRIFIEDATIQEGYPIDQGKGADRVLAVFHRVGGPRWAAIVESSYRDVLAPIRQMGTRVLVIGVGMGILFGVLGLSMVNKILRPLDDLEEGLQRIGRGDLSGRIEIKTGDELERVAETVNKMALSLAATDRTKRDLTHMIVHDLKNPLSATLGSIECVLQMNQDTLSPDTKKLLTLGAKSGKELLRLIQNLLDMAKMEEGQLKIHPEYFSLLELAGQCVDDLEIQMAKENKVISVEVDPHLPKAWADRDLVHRVLANLLTNALKHTPPKTEISIHVRLDRNANAFVVSVQDTGEGVPADFKERIFEKFSQAEAKRRNTRVGSGLGLTFCKLAVEAHKGRIWVESEPGMGSEFCFSLPLPVQNCEAADVLQENKTTSGV